MLKDKPLLTKAFLNFFKKLNNKNKTYLEIGSGYSTLYFSKHFKNVISLENDKVWFNKIKKEKPKNVKLNLFNKDNIGDILLKELNKKPDYIMIDNNPHYISRFDLAKFVNDNKKNDCIILLDNGPWNMEAFNFLRQNYFCLDFFGDRYDNKTSVTSVFFTEKNYRLLY